METIALLIGLFFFLCLVRVPIPFALGISALIIILMIDVAPRQVVVHMMRNTDMFSLLAIPLFILAGEIMNRSDLTERLLTFATALVGRIRGGLAHVNVVVSMIMAGVSGSSSADAAGVGAVLIPAMVRAGYPVNFSVAITAMSSTLGNIIPPSIYMVVYGAMGGVSIGALFLGGAMPGILIGGTQMAMIALKAKRKNFPYAEKMTMKERLHATKRASLALLIPVIIVGGIVSGIYAPTEAAVTLVFYCLFITLFVYKSLKWNEIPEVMLAGARVSVLPLFTVACAGPFGWLIGYLRGPDMVAEAMISITQEPLLVMCLLIGFLLILGTFLSEIATIIIFLPIIQKLGAMGGMHPVQLGVIVVMVLCLGLVTPPYGICLLIGCSIGKINVLDAFWECLIFVVLFLIIVFLCVLIPGLTLWLPSVIMPDFRL
ncbi:MAG: C4-dicarboxylate TRAP transporter large permease protein DctM [Desulfovibrio sp.]